MPVVFRQSVTLIIIKIEEKIKHHYLEYQKS